MATKNNNECSSQALSQGDNATTCSTPNDINANQIKSGSLFLSSKGIGWTSWKKRWFILTRTSLVFYRSDPNAAPQKGGEMNLTLGGIDLNSSASVEVKPDKKLITMFFPDGRDGRAFTLKAETMDDLYEWKSALESALAQAPSATHSTGNGVFSNEQTGVANGPGDQQNDKSAVESVVIGRPILLVLEDIDGSPSFLEKALTFIENYGVKVEGILRQAADVEEVHRRVCEYEQGKTEFSPNEDAHIIADCIKYILRELPSSPVPASCCTALLQAFKSGRANKANNIRTAILETFPEPNRKLLQRILIMCKKVASHKAENLMSISAVAACMSPLLLRPLLSGECELENTHMDVAGDGSLQLLQAAAAANHAQAIIITLLEEYNLIFGDGRVAPELLSNSEECGSETEEASDEEYEDEDEEEYEDEDEEEYEDEDEDYDLESGSDEHGTETDGDYQHSVAGANSDNEEMNDDRAKRNSSIEPNDLLLQEEKEIERLIAVKMELQNRIAEEADANAKLKAKLEKRKKALHEHRLTLEKDVVGLREQLQKERDIRATLEAEMSTTQLPGSASSNDKMKVDIEGIAVAELKFNNLKQRLDDLGAELNHQIHQNITLMQDKVINMENATREASSRIERSCESEHQSQSSDPLKGGSSKTGWLSSVEVPDAKNSSSPSNNSIRGEGDNPTSSALTKLTTRLNALKQKRNQIASELHNIDKIQGPSGPTTQNPNATAYNVDKSQGPQGNANRS